MRLEVVDLNCLAWLGAKFTCLGFFTSFSEVFFFFLLG